MIILTVNLAQIVQQPIMIEEPKQKESIKKESVVKTEFFGQHTPSDKAKYDYDAYYKKINDIM